MLKEFEKLFLVGIIGFLAFVSIYGVLSMYSSYIIKSRQLSYLLVKTQLSTLSDTDKKQMMADTYMRNPQGRTWAFDFSRSLANFDRKAPAAAQCLDLLADFQNQAAVCLYNTPTNPLGVALYSCPPADDGALKLKNSCNIDVGWR